MLKLDTKTNDLDTGEVLSTLDASDGDDHWDKIVDIAGIVRDKVNEFLTNYFLDRFKELLCLRGNPSQSINAALVGYSRQKSRDPNRKRRTLVRVLSMLSFG